MSEKLKKAANTLFDVIELYIPSAAFIVFFVFYIILIIWRYVIRQSIPWMMEMSTMLYLLMAVAASSYGSRKDTHVVFSVVYDRLSEPWQRAVRILMDLVVCGVPAVLIPISYKSIMFVQVKTSQILKLPYNILYFPFMIFIVLSFIHHLVDLIRTIGRCVAAGKGA